MAYRMQIAVPEVMNINDEPKYIHEMYGTHPGKESFANNVLLARKLVEKGVRFVQLFDWGWDSHGTDASLAIDIGLINKCRQTDKAVTALLLDLKQRGLLEETLVIWGGEFGRTPVVEMPTPGQNSGKINGRDHNHYGFTMWLAGGGVKGGHVHGATDDFGFRAERDIVHVHDLHATLLHLLGFDHEKFTYRYAGRDFRLTDVHGQVVSDLIA